MNRVKPNPNFKEINHSSCEVTKHREMQKQYYVLKKFNWLLLKNDDKISDPDMEKKYNRVLEGYYNYYDLVEYMIKTDSQLEEALYLKDELKDSLINPIQIPQRTILMNLLENSNRAVFQS